MAAWPGVDGLGANRQRGNGRSGNRERANGAGTTGDTAAAVSSESSAHPTRSAAALALLFFLPALGVSVWVLGKDGAPTFVAAEGVGAFVLFYVVAQAAERFVEMVMPLSEEAVERAGGTPKSQRVKERDEAVVAAVRAVHDAGAAAAQAEAEEAADKQAAVDQARADRTLVAFGATAALGMLLCGYLGADFLTAVGVDFTPDGKDPGWLSRLVMMAVTGLVVGAGSKQLNDTISVLGKTSAQKSTPAETGGTA